MKRYVLVHLENDESFLCNFDDNEGDWVKWEDARAEIEQLRGNLSLAEEGLANYAQENERLNAHCAQLSKEHHDALDEVERLRALLTQAPIAKVTVRESGAGHYAPDDVSVSLYAPGLPPGEHDLYLMPSVPQPGPTNEKA